MMGEEREEREENAMFELTVMMRRNKMGSYKGGEK